MSEAKQVLGQHFVLFIGVEVTDSINRQRMDDMELSEASHLYKQI